MSDDAVVENAETVEDSGEGTENAEVFLSFSSQEEVDKWIGARLGKERDKTRSEFEGYEDYKAAAEELAQIKAQKAEADKASLSETERLQAELDEALSKLAERDKSVADFEAKIASFEAAQLRSEVAAEKGLPAVLAARLSGSTREELEADADELLQLVPQAPAGKPKANELRGGGNAGDDEEPELTAAQIADKLGSLNSLRSL